MTLSEMLPTIQALPRSDKLRLIQVLAADIASEEEAAIDMSGKTFPVWSPFDSFEGADTLLQMLDKRESV